MALGIDNWLLTTNCGFVAFLLDFFTLVLLAVFDSALVWALLQVSTVGDLMILLSLWCPEVIRSTTKIWMFPCFSTNWYECEHIDLHKATSLCIWFLIIHFIGLWRPQNKTLSLQMRTHMIGPNKTRIWKHPVDTLGINPASFPILITNTNVASWQLDDFQTSIINAVMIILEKIDLQFFHQLFASRNPGHFITTVLNLYLFVGSLHVA